MQKPNIVFILADDMGYGDFSRYNKGISKTPVLDDLFEEGICFSHQYTASPVCNPSRAALMTGRYPHRTGSIDTLEWRGLERLHLDETTLAQVFQAGGYKTGLVGKWHLGTYDTRYLPYNRGFEEAVYFAGGMHDYFDWTIRYNDTLKKRDGRYLTDVWTDEAVSFIKRNHTQPFFLHVAYNAPHTPLQAPDEEIKPFLDTGKFTKGVATIYGMLHRMDKGIAKILETLKDCGIDNNTLFIFTSDNGPHLGGTGENALQRFNCNLHGAKCLVYEGGIRVPLLARMPGQIEQNVEIGDMIHFCDWFPTLLQIAGIEIPDDLALDGADISPLLRGETGTLPDQRFWQWNRFEPEITCNAAVRDGDWKLVRPAIDEAIGFTEYNWLEKSMFEPDYFWEHGILNEPFPERQLPSPPKPELYNIKEDPLEAHNLASTHPEKTKKLLTDLENWFEQVEYERRSKQDF